MVSSSLEDLPSVSTISGLTNPTYGWISLADNDITPSGRSIGPYRVRDCLLHYCLSTPVFSSGFCFLLAAALHRAAVQCRDDHGMTTYIFAVVGNTACAELKTIVFSAPSGQRQEVKIGIGAGRDLTRAGY